jgi:hypothetical protein
MTAVKGKMTKHVHEWGRYVGYRFEKEILSGKHKGTYFMEVLSRDCVVHSGPSIRGIVVWNPVLDGVNATSPTAQTLVAGGWRHAITGFYDIPAPKFLYPILDKKVPFTEAFVLGQKHENAANLEAGSTKRSFGDASVERMELCRTVDIVEKEYLLDRLCSLLSE